MRWRGRELRLLRRIEAAQDGLPRADGALRGARGRYVGHDVFGDPVDAWHGTGGTFRTAPSTAATSSVLQPHQG